jgi:hypothetical protein
MLKKSKLIKILENLSISNIVDKAYEGFIEGTCDGVAKLNLDTGELEAASYMGNNFDRGKTIELYRIDADIEFPEDELLNRFEQDEYEESGLSFEDYCKQEGIDIDDLKTNYLCFYLRENEVKKRQEWLNELDDAYDGGNDETGIPHENETLQTNYSNFHNYY